MGIRDRIDAGLEYKLSFECDRGDVVTMLLDMVRSSSYPSRAGDPLITRVAVIDFALIIKCQTQGHLLTILLQADGNMELLGMIMESLKWDLVGEHTMKVSHNLLSTTLCN